MQKKHSTTMIYDLKQQTRNRRKLSLIKGIYGKPTADILLNVSKVKSITRQLPTRLYVSPFTPLLPPMPKSLQLSPSLPLTVPLSYCSLCSFLSVFLRIFVEPWSRWMLHTWSSESVITRWILQVQKIWGIRWFKR